jgi:hypothetical protein
MQEGIMTNIIVALILLGIVGSAIAKIIIEKKKGAKCIGCPYGGNSKSKCNCNTGK